MKPDPEYTYQTRNYNEPMKPELSHKKVVIVADGSFPTHAAPLKSLHEADFVVCCDGAAAALTNYGIEPGVIIGDLDSLTNELAERFSDRLLPDPDQETNDLTKAVNWCAAHKATDLVILGATGKREDHTLGNISLLASYGKLISPSADPSLNSRAAAPSDNHGKPENNHYNSAAVPAESFENPSDSGSEPALNSHAVMPNRSSENSSDPSNNPTQNPLTVKIITDTGTLFPVYGTCTIEAFPGQSVSIFSLDSTAEVTSSGLKYPLNKVIVSSWWIATLNIATGTSFTLTLSPAPLIIYLGHPQP